MLLSQCRGPCWKGALTEIGELLEWVERGLIKMTLKWVCVLERGREGAAIGRRAHPIKLLPNAIALPKRGGLDGVNR